MLPRYASYLAGATVRATYGTRAAAKTVLFPTAESCGRSEAVHDGTRERIGAGTFLVEHDRMLARLSVTVSGKADVRLEPKGRRASSRGHTSSSRRFSKKGLMWNRSWAIASARISHGCLNPHGNHRVKIWVRGVATQTPVAPANQSARRNDES